MPRKAASSAKKVRKTTKKSVARANTQKSPKSVPEKTIRHDYIFAVGRRKSAVARVRYYGKKENSILINGQDLRKYFPTPALHNIVTSPISNTNTNGLFSIYVAGGGKRGQAEATRLGIARAIIKKDPLLRKQLKVLGFLTRDPRIKERKKYGLKRARRAPQWQKR